jgi:hypothetical protein
MPHIETANVRRALEALWTDRVALACSPLVEQFALLNRAYGLLIQRYQLAGTQLASEDLCAAAEVDRTLEALALELGRYYSDKG